MREVLNKRIENLLLEIIQILDQLQTVSDEDQPAISDKVILRGSII
jgi:hypothetical protein